MRLEEIITQWHHDNKERWPVPRDDMLALVPYLEPMGGDFDDDDVLIIWHFISQVALYKTMRPHRNATARHDKHTAPALKAIETLRSFIGDNIVTADAEYLNELDRLLKKFGSDLDDKKWVKLHNRAGAFGSPFSTDKKSVKTSLNQCLEMMNRTMTEQDKRDLITAI